MRGKVKMMDNSINQAFDGYEKIKKKLQEINPQANNNDAFKMYILAGLEEISFMLADIMGAIEDK